jgi:putative FmdB family regulatory protein
MPIYEYECPCGKRFEKVESIKTTNIDRRKCECGRMGTISPSRPANPILVGRGFHANDYGSPTK